MPSRHDHFPRADAARRHAMRSAASALDAAWREADDAPAGLASAIDAVDTLSPAAAIDRLLPWLHDTRWLSDRLGQALSLLRADPFARPPLRSVGNGEAGGLILAERGAVRLTLQIRRVEAVATAAAAKTTLFVPGALALRVLAPGGAMLALHRVAVDAAEEAGGFTAAGAAPCHSAPPRPFVTGEVIRLDTARESFSVSGGDGDALSLELAVQPPARLPIRAYDIASGRLVHVAASRRDSSFRAMALTLLRQFGRADAAPLFAEEAMSEDFAARWGAARELVALDPAAAHSILAGMAAADPHPDVRRAAAATLALYTESKAA